MENPGTLEGGTPHYSVSYLFLMVKTAITHCLINQIVHADSIVESLETA